MLGCATHHMPFMYLILFCELGSSSLCFSSEMTIYVLEKSAMGGSRRLLAVDVFMYLQNNTNWKVRYLDERGGRIEGENGEGGRERGRQRN